MSIHTKNKLIYYSDKITFFLLILYSLTFIFDLKINLLKTAFLFSLVNFFLIKPKIKITSKILYYIVFFFFSIFIVSLLNPNASLLEYKSRFLSPFIGFLLIFTFKFTPKRIFILLLSLTFCLSINSLNVIWQFFNNNSRPTGFSTAHYMFIAICNTLILPIIFSVYLNLSSNKTSKIIIYLLGISLIINIPAIIFENTRIVYISIFISFFIILLVSIKRKIKILTYIFSLFICIFIIFQNSPQSTERFNSITQINYENQSNFERILMWQSAIKMFIDHPSLGVGIGNYYNEYINHYRSPLSRETQGHPHNTFLYILSETGFFGGISFLILYIYLLSHSIKTYIKYHSISSIAYLGCLISFFIHSQTDCIFSSIGFKQLTYLFWLITAIYLLLNNYITISYKEDNTHDFNHQLY